jgi:hypothetical protein
MMFLKRARPFEARTYAGEIREDRADHGIVGETIFHIINPKAG